MKTENNSKKVEKTFSWSVYDVTLEINQVCEKCAMHNSLKIDYRVAAVSDNSLSAFLEKIKIEPISSYSEQFFSDVPHFTVITIDKVEPTKYTIGKCIDSSACFILSCNQYFKSTCLINCNRDLINYKDNFK